MCLCFLLVCAAGTEGDGVTCTDCILSYQPGGVSGNVNCTSCPPNTRAPNRATSAAACTGGSKDKYTRLQQTHFDFLPGVFSIFQIVGKPASFHKFYPIER